MRISTSKVEEFWKLPNGALRNMRNLPNFPDKDDAGTFDYKEITDFLIQQKALPALAKDNEKSQAAAEDLKMYQALNEKLKSDKQQLELQQMRGELIEITYVQNELGKFLINLKESLITQTMSRIDDVYEAETVEHARMQMRKLITSAINFNAKQNEELLTIIEDESNDDVDQPPSEADQNNTDE